VVSLRCLPPRIAVADNHPSSPSPEILDFLRSLAPGTVVAQLDDGRLAVCSSVEEAEQQFETFDDTVETPLPRRGWSRIAAAIPG
jgi:hypothetical protein